jgi:hypothetical protein
VARRRTRVVLRGEVGTLAAVRRWRGRRTPRVVADGSEWRLDHRRGRRRAIAGWRRHRADARRRGTFSAFGRVGRCRGRRADCARRIA